MAEALLSGVGRKTYLGIRSSISPLGSQLEKKMNGSPALNNTAYIIGNGRYCEKKNRQNGCRIEEGNRPRQMRTAARLIADRKDV